MAKLKAYVMSNLDGRREAMVAASTLAEAAKLMRTSPKHMRDWGWYLAKDDDAALALATPGTVLFRRIATESPWLPDERAS